MIVFVTIVPVDTLPLAGRDQGWGMFSPDIRANHHPLPTSPVEGEVPFRAWGWHL